MTLMVAKADKRKKTKDEFELKREKETADIEKSFNELKQKLMK